MIKKNSGLKRERCIILFNVFPMYFFWLENYFDMCFDILIKFYVSHHYYMIEAI
jgi:hypothetical protein